MLLEIVESGSRRNGTCVKAIDPGAGRTVGFVEGLDHGICPRVIVRPLGDVRPSLRSGAHTVHPIFAIASSPGYSSTRRGMLFGFRCH